MLRRVGRFALRHRGIVTVILLAGLLTNLLVVGRLDPPSLRQHGDLPLAASCQGGGPGCAEQPLIPPPAVGMPHFDAPPPAAFGALVLVEPAAPVVLHESPPPRLERPPISTVSV
jgi:hypothetical protein